MTTLSNQTSMYRRVRQWARRPDPVIAIVMFVLGCVVLWSCLPFAVGASIAPVGSGTRVNLDVPVTLSMTPGWKAGDSSVRLDDLTTPGVVNDASSAGWRLTTNYPGGYEVRVRSTSEPALRGTNAIDGNAARDSFQDFASTAACPCIWKNDSARKGVFGYSVVVSNSAGAPANDAAAWGTANARKWRGFKKSSYRAFSTAGGAGTYNMTLLLRTEVPENAVQVEGSYRASVVVSTHPML